MGGRAAGPHRRAAVRDYATMDDGLDATVATLRTGAAAWGYQWVLASLADCAPASTTLRAVNASSWCGGCAGGTYAIGQLDAVVADPLAFADQLVGES